MLARVHISKTDITQYTKWCINGKDHFHQSAATSGVEYNYLVREDFFIEARRHSLLQKLQKSISLVETTKVI